jgi:hypothetical protein
MKTSNKMKIRLVLGIAAFCSAIISSPASAFNLDPEIIRFVNSMIVPMQQETMKELYAQAPLKNQMRGRMMQDFSSKLFLKDKIQPVMMEQTIRNTRGMFMQRMVERPIPIPK